MSQRLRTIFSLKIIKHMRNLKILLSKISRQRKREALLITLLMVSAAIMEVAILGAVLPLISMLANQKVDNCQITKFFCDMSESNIPIAFAIIISLSAAIRLFLLHFSTHFSFNLGADFGNQLFRRMLYQPYEYHVNHNTSEVIGAVNKVNILVQQVINPFIQGIVSIVISLALFVTLLRISIFSATFSAIAFSLIYAFVYKLFQSKLLKNGKTISYLETHRIKVIQEGLGGIREVIINNTQDFYDDSFATINKQQRKAQAENVFIKSAPRYILEWIAFIFLILVALSYQWSPSLETNSLAVLGSLALGAQKLLPQLQQIYNSWVSVRSNHAILKELVGLLEKDISKEYICDIKTNKRISNIFLQKKHDIPLINIKNLSFKFKSNNIAIFDNVSLSINHSDRVGFVGKSGVGKSTLIDLITGLIMPTAGKIEIYGHVLSPDNSLAWRARIAQVSQTVFLFDTTIAENIALGCNKDSINMELLQKCLKMSKLNDFIESLPDGYNTVIGEGGVKLSGGQRQRIGLARAFYKGADILILDEATSALDDDTEKDILLSIDSLEYGITVISIAHRISALKNCNRIFEISKGQVLERKPHTK